MTGVLQQRSCAYAIALLDFQKSGHRTTPVLVETKELVIAPVPEVVINSSSITSTSLAAAPKVM